MGQRPGCSILGASPERKQLARIQGQALSVSYNTYIYYPLPPIHTHTHTHTHAHIHTHLFTKSIIGLYDELVLGYCAKETHFLRKHLINICHVYSLEYIRICVSGPQIHMQIE